MDIIEALKIVYPKEFIRHVPSDDLTGFLFMGEDIKRLISPLKIVNKINHTDIVMLADKFTTPLRGPAKNTSYSTYYKESFVREMIKDHLPRVQAILNKPKPKPNTVPPLVTPIEVSKSAVRTTHIDPHFWEVTDFRSKNTSIPSNVLLTSDKLKSMIRNAFPDELFVENLVFGKESNSYRSSLFLPKYNISFELPNFKYSPETRCDFSRRTNTRCISIADETTFGGDLVEAMRNFSVSIGVANSLIQKFFQSSTD